jgi:hypothetical protein
VRSTSRIYEHHLLHFLISRKKLLTQIKRKWTQLGSIIRNVVHSLILQYVTKNNIVVIEYKERLCLLSDLMLLKFHEQHIII